MLMWSEVISESENALILDKKNYKSMNLKGIAIIN